jgi:hypothetical protein
VLLTRGVYKERGVLASESASENAEGVAEMEGEDKCPVEELSADQIESTLCACVSQQILFRNYTCHVLTLNLPNREV